MKIGLFFGSFNPVHYGHISIAEYFIHKNLVDEVWFVVSPQSPFKQDFTASDFKHAEGNIRNCIDTPENRIELLNTAIQGCHKLKVCDTELSMPVPSYTIDTIRKIKSECDSSYQFALIMGSDQLPKFKGWKEWTSILEEVEVYVYPRNPEDLEFLLPRMRFFEDAPLLDISSTQLREKMRL